MTTEHQVQKWKDWVQQLQFNLAAARRDRDLAQQETKRAERERDQWQKSDQETCKALGQAVTARDEYRRTAELEESARIVQEVRADNAERERDEALRRASEAEGEEMSRGQLLVALDRITERLDNLTGNRETQDEVTERRPDEGTESEESLHTTIDYLRDKLNRCERERDEWEKNAEDAMRERDALQNCVDRVTELYEAWEAGRITHVTPNTIRQVVWDGIHEAAPGSVINPEFEEVSGWGQSPTDVDPLFKVGQWVRIVGWKKIGYPSVGCVEDICRHHTHAQTAYFIDGIWHTGRELEAWQPYSGELVMGKSCSGRSTYTGKYAPNYRPQYDHGGCVALRIRPTMHAWVQWDSLKPVREGDSLKPVREEDDND